MDYYFLTNAGVHEISNAENWFLVSLNYALLL
jgi:hypothetical protein